MINKYVINSTLVNKIKVALMEYEMQSRCTI